MAGPHLTIVGSTALSVARIRAAESQRPDRLFDDPFAAAFVAAAGDVSRPAPAGPAAQAIRGRIVRHVIIRTRYFDGYLQRAVDGGCRQVVLIAAGLDARAFRLPWPATTDWYELDTAEIVSFKESVLAEVGAVPRCRRSVVPVDLRADWAAALADAGHRADQATAWLIEGLLVYLDARAAQGLLETVTSVSAAGSRVSFETGIMPGVRLRRANTDPALAEVTSVWQGGMADAEPVWLAEHGWSVELAPHAARAASYGRPDPESDVDSGVDSGVDHLCYLEAHLRQPGHAMLARCHIG